MAAGSLGSFFELIEQSCIDMVWKLAASKHNGKGLEAGIHHYVVRKLLHHVDDVGRKFGVPSRRGMAEYVFAGQRHGCADLHEFCTRSGFPPPAKEGRMPRFWF